MVIVSASHGFRPCILRALLAAFIGLGAAHAGANDQVAFASHKEAVAKSLELDLGAMSLISPDPKIPVVAADYGTFRFSYRSGATPIETGGSIRLSMRHVFHWSPPQISDPAAAGYVTVTGPDDVVLEIVPWIAHPDAHDMFLEMFPWQHAIEIKVVEGTLKAGDEIELTYGDASKGGPGARIQPTKQRSYLFRTYVRQNSASQLLPLPEDISIEITGAPVDRLRIVAGHTSDPERVKLTVSAEDLYGNLASGYSGTMELLDDQDTLLRAISFGPNEAALKTIEVVAPQTSGAFRFKVRADEMSATSNPLNNNQDSNGYITFFGDIHGHSFDSDGHGTPEDFYKFCRDVAALDFCALTDHDFMISDESWAENVATTDSFNRPGSFVALRAYEWSGMTDVGGDHNVYFRGNESPLFRSRSYYDYRNQQAYHGNQPQINFIEDLYNVLLQKLDPNDVMVIPHLGGRAANPKWHNGKLERNIEIFSDHQRSQEWAYSFLSAGYRLGIIASTDNHTGRPGYGFLQNPLDQTQPVEIGTALVAVKAKELTRDAIFDALINRQVYATSGDRILLDTKMGTATMGGEGESASAQPLQYSVKGTDTIDRIEIIRDGALVQTIPGAGLAMSGTWLDTTQGQGQGQGKAVAYWVRIVQDNGEEAISSPIWWKVD